eukprot:579465-Prymnesium_polylepis.1
MASSTTGMRHRRTSRDGVTTAEGETRPLTAGEWARTMWISSQQDAYVTYARSVDLLRGYGQRVDLYTIVMKLALTVLMAYSAYLLFCESCKD